MNGKFCEQNSQECFGFLSREGRWCVLPGAGIGRENEGEEYVN